MSPWRKGGFVITVAVVTRGCPPLGPGPLRSGAGPWKGLVPASAVSVVPSVMGQLSISELSASPLRGRGAWKGVSLIVASSSSSSWQCNTEFV